MKSFYDVFNIRGDPSVSAAHCQFPFQGSLKISLLYDIELVDTACRVRCFYSKKNSVENVPPERFQNQNTASGTQGRSGLVRSALEKLSLFSPTFPVRQKYGAGNFAVCGQRLRGHVPSKNTSPTALSWISLTSPTISVLFVSARCFEVLFLRFYGILTGHGTTCPYKTIISPTQNGQPLSGLPTIFAVISDACLTDGCNR